MSSPKRRGELGLTQIELLVALAIGLILLTLAVFPFFISQLKGYAIQDDTAKMQQRARIAEDYITRAVQQAGAFALTGAGGHVSMRGLPIIAAGDYYIGVQYDEPTGSTPGVITSDEVVLFALSKEGGGSTHTVDTRIGYDANNDGVVSDGEIVDWSVPLTLTGPPYNLYRITPTSGGSDSIKELIATDVDNLVLRYYDSDGMLIPAGTTTSRYDLSGEQRKQIKSIEINLALRADKPDDKYTGEFALDDNSVGTYTASDTGGRTGVVLGKSGADDDYETNRQYRRRGYTTIASLRNVNTDECGSISVDTTDAGPLCPAGTQITATVMGPDLEPAADGTPVSFTITVNDPAHPATLSAGAAGTVGGAATVTLNYTGLSRTIVVEGSVTQVCSGVSRNLTDNVAVNFQPGPPVKALFGPEIYTFDPANPFSGANIFMTCATGERMDFSLEGYDQCDNPVGQGSPAIEFDPMPAGNSQIVAAGSAYRMTPGTGAMTGSPDYTMAAQVKLPLPGWITDGLWTGADIATAVPLGGPPYIPYTATIAPWPPTSFSLTGDSIGAAAPEDCTGTYNYTNIYNVADCNGNPINNLARSGAFSILARVTPEGTLSQTATGDISHPGATPATTDVVANPAQNSIVFQNADSGDGLYSVTYTKKPCTIDPSKFTSANPAKAAVSVSPVGFAGGSGVTSKPTLAPCRTCNLIAATDVVSTCEGFATVTVGGCDFANKQVLITLSGGVDPYWVDQTTHLPLDGVKARGIIVTTDATGHHTAVFSIGNTPSGQSILATAGSIAGEAPPWSCENAALVTVSNKCRDFKIYYKSELGNQDIVSGGKYCAQLLGTIYFQLKHCKHESGKLPNPLTVIVYDQYGQTFDREDIYFYPLDATTPHALYEGSINLLPNPAVQGSLGNNKLEFPKEKSASMKIIPWKDDDDPTDTCPDTEWEMSLIPPLPLCFPNAITSGGGASWNGNFKVHWGDVVVRGQLTTPAANKRIKKLITGQYDGSSFGGAGNTDRLFDLYVGKANTGDAYDGLIQGAPLPTGPGIYQPYMADGFGQYFTNISNTRINEMIVELNYDLMRELALGHSSNSYWCAIPSATTINGTSYAVGSLYNPKTKKASTFGNLLQYPNPNNNGDFMFLDTWCKAGAGGTGPLWIADMTQTDALINATSIKAASGKAVTTALPRYSISGSFYTKGILYVAGSMEFGGLGSTTPVTVKAPPPKDLYIAPHTSYDHNSSVYTETQIPIRPDPSLTGSTFTVNVHVNGAIYVDGEFAGSGNPAVFGAINSERGYSGSGEPELWYNYQLNQSGIVNALCVDCCKITVSPSAVDVSPGGTKQLTAKDYTAPLTYQSSDTAVATVSPSGLVTGVGEGNTTVWIVDNNNCAISVPVRVGTQCVGLAIDPPVIPKLGETFKLGTGVEPSANAAVVDDAGQTYVSAAWNWTAATDAAGKVVVTAEPLYDGAYTAVITGKKCGSTAIKATDRNGYCTGTYEGIVTVGSSIDISTIDPIKTSYEVGDTVTLTATGGNGTLVWHAAPATAVTAPSWTGSTITVTFVQANADIAIDVSDSLDCVSASKHFTSRCPTPTLATLHPADGSTWGTDATNPLSGGRDLWWRIEPSDDHLVNSTIYSTNFDQLNKVTFSMSPVPPGITSPRDEFIWQFCGLLGGNNCSVDAVTSVAGWPSGEYTLTGTGVATYTEPVVIAACGATRTASSSIKINIDNCAYDYVDYFNSLSALWSLNCFSAGCSNAASTLWVEGASNLLKAQFANPNASTGPGMVIMGPGAYATTWANSYAVQGTMSGMLDTDLATTDNSAQGIIIATDTNNLSKPHFILGGEANPDGIWDTPQTLFVSYDDGSTTVKKIYAAMTPPYDLRIEKVGNVLTAKAKASTSTTWTTLETFTLSGLGISPTVNGFFVDTPSRTNTYTEAWFDYFKQECL